ncbi:MAG: class I adenylate-forming enzyme family protein [Clostridia bacterium]
MRRIHVLFDEWLKKDPQRAFIHLKDDAPITFERLGRLTNQAEAELKENGVGVGDRVMAVVENCPEHVALILACSRLGAWSCGVNARMSPGEIVAYAAKADPKVMYFTDEAQAGRWHAAPSSLAGLKVVRSEKETRPETGELADKVAAIIFTSGTSGTPKGVMMTHDGVMHFGRVSAESRELGPDDRSYAYLPMTHIFGLGTVLMSSLYAGSGLVMRRRFEAADALDALEHHGVSQLQGPPQFFARLLAHMEEKRISRPVAPKLRYVYTGAGPLDLALKRRVEAAFGLPLHHGYGLSEYAGSVHVSRLNERRDDTSAGYRFEGAELRIVDPHTGRDLPAGERGEIWLRGRGLMPGYFRDETATREVMREGGWYASGDLGELAPDGALFVVGRLKEMIIRSGFNVYPAEVEAVLHAFPGIERAAVVGRKEPDGNEQVLAFVELRHGASLDQAALRAHLEENLAPYKRPAMVKAVPELPVSTSGKLIKRRLLELYPA